MMIFLISIGGSAGNVILFIMSVGRLRVAVRRLLKLVSVDLGCGFHKVSPFFVGVDKNKVCADVVADLENLSCFEDSSVSVIFCRRALQHVRDDVKALREINRVLSFDGVAVVETASVFNAVFSKFLNFLRLKTYCYDVFHVYSSFGLLEKIRLSGLKVYFFGSVPTRFPFSNYFIVLLKGGLKTA